MYYTEVQVNQFSAMRGDDTFDFVDILRNVRVSRREGVWKHEKGIIVADFP